MNVRQIAKARLELKHAGAPADRNHLRTTLVSRLGNDLEVLRQRKEAVGREFRRQLERWRTEEVPGNVPVSAIPGDVHDSRLYRLTAVFALLSEMALAAWIFQRVGIAWWFGVITAIFITFTLHGVFLQIFDNPERPKEAVHRLRRVAVLPAIFAFIIALVLGVLARYVYGSLAVALLPLFSVSLWLGTISLLALAASLFSVAHLKSWSLRYDREYRALDTDERASSGFLEELQGEATSDSHSAQPLQDVSALTATRTHGGRNMTVSALLPLLFLLSWNTGCSTSVAPADLPAATTAEAGIDTDPASVPPVALHIMVDWSGSCVRPAMEECWLTLRRELPCLIESLNAGRLTLWSFDEDGWCPKRLGEISLPVLNLPPRRDTTAGEWDSFHNIRDALREAEDREWGNRRKAAEDSYRRELEEALKPLESATPLPEPGYKTGGTDIIGLLKRISQTREQSARLYIIITDLADTQYRNLPHVTAPEGRVRTVALLLPAQPKDSLLTLGKSLPGPEQFELRSRQLRESAPWVVPVPYFSQSLTPIVNLKSGH